MTGDAKSPAPHRFEALAGAVRDMLAKQMSADAAFFFSRAPSLEEQRDSMFEALTAIKARIAEPMDSARNRERIVNDVTRWCDAALDKFEGDT